MKQISKSVGLWRGSRSKQSKRMLPALPMDLFLSDLKPLTLVAYALGVPL